MEISLPVLALLTLAAFMAGVVDAIAGGGGLITLPALLAAGLPPQLALGTNKGQSVFGALAAMLRYGRAGLLDPRQGVLTFPAGLVGSLLGAALVLRVDPAVLRPLVLALLIAAGLVVALRKPLPAPRRERPRPARAIAVALSLLIGAYDGFFGPGTGTFLLLAFVWALELSLPRATAEAKVVNFASNLAAVSLFGLGGLVLWGIALPMAAGQALGGWVGAHLALKGGEQAIRRAVLVVVLALVLKPARDFFL